MSTVIEQAVEARLVASAPRMETVPATLRYDRRDPFAVRMSFPAAAALEGVEVVWEFSRELLLAGLRRPAGSGDVRVRPWGRDRAVLEFHVPEGVAMVQVCRSELWRFAQRTLQVVPVGFEHLYLDLDHDLARLLRDAR
ncbi:SsgA family sporulation/cell division regulator [Streptomyces sp. MUM 203J]|uniref:SsgA family sporulation/cell division regulator n=1 Tax=Streptomyces sp. MUM 203J TaxID=2791990 RepID=UPI001F047520|nr:SsgA family sporulation/cell division regulator [Streptomyces sp. MUM 203J]MCH0541693.1 SsgA family sporulation/cell division regulator [Streptomyces sp. MUM 203J]